MVGRISVYQSLGDDGLPDGKEITIGPDWDIGPPHTDHICYLKPNKLAWWVKWRRWTSEKHRVLWIGRMPPEVCESTDGTMSAGALGSTDGGIH